uniref:protein-tyrosine-phosphatase n=1 Tax=Crassostrea virginica TaxID=6565 RepID=A0A8B8BUD6_CRAVI|nr:receptor-type tyrosine-protein phosphatase alpha-like isoform X4 [Crassostrea virginica]
MWTEFCVLLHFVARASGFVNLAHTPAQQLQGAANMSKPPQDPAWSANKAVDGNTSQELLTTCAVMDYTKNYNSVWWKVRLGRRFNVAYLEVYFRSSTITRATGYYFYSYDSTDVFDPNSLHPNNLIYHHNPISGCPASIQNINVNRLAQEIVYINKRPQDHISTCIGADSQKTTVEICEVKVMGCDANRYSNGCGKKCDGKCKSHQCDAFNGSCIYGCADPNALTIDCLVCQDGQYISNKQCKPCQGHCKDGTPCNKLTGKCDNGCNNHWTGSFCETCSLGYYGDDCNSECGKCAGNDVCDNQSGDCPGECLGNWQKPKCNACSLGYYGDDCNSECGKCAGNDGCDSHSGDCAGECLGNWQKPKCNECLDGFYGSTCNATCGYCKDKQPCDKDSGECVHGCKPHYEQPLCEECSDGFHGSTCNSTCGNCTDGQPCDKNTGKCLSGCRPHYKPPFCKVKSTPQTGDEETNTGAIAGGVVAVLIVVVIVGLAGFFFKRRQGVNKRDPAGHVQIVSNDRKKGSKGNKYADISDNSLERSQEEHTDAALSGDDGGYYNTAEITAYIRTQDLHRVILEKNKKENNVFLDEYKRLPVGNTDKCKIGQQKGNVVKNRFKTTFPYDHSRVILTEKWTDNDNDYINANFIKNCNGDKAYIAAQGPKKVTLADFWRMIWQENVKLVVMLTNIVENGKNKCTQYWPEKDKGMDVGPCKIKLLEETEYAFHTYRKFTVQQNNSNTRTIAQFHYTAWPDHGTPEELGLVQFHRAVTQKYQTGGLMLVHCSAGVGRTGTFIGLDSLLQQGREFGRINVFEFVNQMREDRMTMVQTAEQYIFLHKALLCGFQENNTMIKEDNIPTKINSLLQDTSPLNQRALYKEYKVLQTLNPAFDDKDKEDGQTPDNRGKNYDLKILPVSKYRPYLTTYIKGRNDYINAVCVPSFTAPGAFILTQFPLKDTEVDLWRLCMDHDVNALVVLGDTNEQGVSWIPQKGSTSFCTPYSLTTENTGSGISGVTQDTMVISIEDQRKELDVFYIPFGNDNAILKGVELLLEKEKQISFTSVIMSKDGAERVGVFCVLHNVLQQLRMDKEVDIFTAVRQVQTRRPEVISKLDEYRRCYELVPVSISEDGIYANM